eukprot:767778-Hanusia_phi.AAC.9
MGDRVPLASTIAEAPVAERATSLGPRPGEEGGEVVSVGLGRLLLLGLVADKHAVESRDVVEVRRLKDNLHCIRKRLESRIGRQCRPLRLHQHAHCSAEHKTQLGSVVEVYPRRREHLEDELTATSRRGRRTEQLYGIQLLLEGKQDVLEDLKLADRRRVGEADLHVAFPHGDAAVNLVDADGDVTGAYVKGRGIRADRLHVVRLVDHNDAVLPQVTQRLAGGRVRQVVVRHEDDVSVGREIARQVVGTDLVGSPMLAQVLDVHQYPQACAPTSFEHAAFCALPLSFDTSGWMHSCWRDPSTAMRGRRLDTEGDGRGWRARGMEASSGGRELELELEPLHPRTPQSRQSVFPVPVGLSSSAWRPGALRASVRASRSLICEV